MLDLKERNKHVRERFIEFLETNYNPQLKVIAKVIGISYQNLVSWKVGSMDYGEKSLGKIEKFLQSRGY